MKIKNNMKYDDRIYYLQSMFPQTLSISEPFLDYHKILKEEEKKEKSKWLSKYDFNASIRNPLSQSHDISIPVSGEVRGRFKQLQSSKMFVNKFKVNSRYKVN